MTTDELKAHTLWKLLGPREQVFLLAYLESEGDVEKAAKASYSPANPTATSSLVRRLLSKDAISTLVSIIDGEDIPSRESLIRVAWQIAKAASSDQTRLDAIQTVARLQGLTATDRGQSGRENLEAYMKEIDNASS